MKILRDTEWKPVGFSKSFEPEGGKPVFFFRHRKHRYVIALNVAKYIDVMNNIVFHLNSMISEKVSVSANIEEEQRNTFIRDLMEQLQIKD